MIDGKFQVRIARKVQVRQYEPVEVEIVQEIDGLSIEHEPAKVAAIIRAVRDQVDMICDEYLHPERYSLDSEG